MRYLKNLFNSGNTGTLITVNIKIYLSNCWRSLSIFSNNMETSTQNLKRPLDPEENDEKWVKRIQLNPIKEDVEAESDFIRRKLRKYILLLSYCGKGYLGMQRNPGTKTIEDELLGAMFKASLIKEDGLSCPQIYRFQRAARTDKGVSAARQIVSVKLPDDVDIPKVINEHLPEQIRVMKAIRVTQKFDAKLQCDARSYSYLTPTFAFAGIEEKTNENYRMTKEGLEELRRILNSFKGTHNFHNFTAKVKHSDHCAKRYIMDISCSETFMRDGLEWILIKVKGQSFVLHQIRKMLGLAMSICRGFASTNSFDQVWTNKKCDIPIAPGLGLVLEEPHYDYYNKKYNDGIHELLKWDSVESEVQAFREKFIDTEIIQTEINEKVTLNWLETLSYHSFNYASDGPIDDQQGEEKNGIRKAAFTLSAKKAEIKNQVEDDNSFIQREAKQISFDNNSASSSIVNSNNSDKDSNVDIKSA